MPVFGKDLAASKSWRPAGTRLENDGSEEPLDDLLTYARAVHFAAALTVAGVVVFSVLIAEPAFRRTNDGGVPATVRRRLAFMAWVGLALALVSGAAWLVLNAEAMSDRVLTEVFSDGVVWLVLTHTGFGRIWLFRFAVACLLAGILFCYGAAPRAKTGGRELLLVGLALAFVATLAWAGHAAGGLGTEAFVHPAADVLHLIAAAAWAGALAPLTILLAAVGADTASLTIARTATRRFSTLGIVSVATLAVTGSVNTFYLAGSVPALVATSYGHLLLAKVALFLVMVAIAAVNRLDLVPKLAETANPTAARQALRLLRRNAMVEVLLGATIIGIVAQLGMQPPGVHQVPASPDAPTHHHHHEGT
jgi:putative copper resistance protein D